MKVTDKEFLDILNGNQTCVLRPSGKLYDEDDTIHFYVHGHCSFISAAVGAELKGEYYNQRGLKKGYSIVNFKIYSYCESN